MHALHLFDVTHIVTTYGYIGIFLILFIESGIFFMLPGDSLLFAAGLLTSTAGLNIVVLIVLSFVATFIGSEVGYFLGTRINRLQQKPFLGSLLRKEHIDTAKKFFEDHGRLAIILSRFVPGVRTFIPVAAGAGEMEAQTFLLYNFLASLLWTTSFPLAGYFLGRSFPAVKEYISIIIVVIVIVSVLPSIVGFLYRKVRKTT